MARLMDQERIRNISSQFQSQVPVLCVAWHWPRRFFFGLSLSGMSVPSFQFAVCSFGVRVRTFDKQDKRQWALWKVWQAEDSSPGLTLTLAHAIRETKCRYVPTWATDNGGPGSLMEAYSNTNIYDLAPAKLAPIIYVLSAPSFVTAPGSHAYIPESTGVLNTAGPVSSLAHGDDTDRPMHRPSVLCCRNAFRTPESLGSHMAHDDAFPSHHGLISNSVTVGG
jgi:hypothetical protein